MKIHWCVCVSARPSSCTNAGGRLMLLTYSTVEICWRHSTLHQSSIPKPDIGRKSRLLPKLWGPRRYIAITFVTGKKKLEWRGQRDGEEGSRTWFLVSTPGWTDTAWRHGPLQSRGKNANIGDGTQSGAENYIDRGHEITACQADMSK